MHWTLADTGFLTACILTGSLLGVLIDHQRRHRD